MTIKKTRTIKTITLLFLIASGYLLLTTPAHAQVAQGDVALTWSANTYTPFDYPGKPLPVYGSVVTVSVASLKSSVSGLETYTYSWYLDGRYKEYSSGENRQAYAFRVESISGGFHSVELKLRNKDGSLALSIFTNIQVAAPQVVITNSGEEAESSRLDISEIKQLKPGQEANFRAIPYFYNIASAKDLEYRWSFNNESIIKIENPTLFNLRIGEGEIESSFQREIVLQATNPKNPIQQAVGKTKIIAVPDKKSGAYTTNMP